MSPFRIAVLAAAVLAVVLICGCDPSDAAETDSDGTVYEYDTYGSGHPDYYCILILTYFPEPDRFLRRIRLNFVI